MQILSFWFLRYVIPIDCNKHINITMLRLNKPYNLSCVPEKKKCFYLYVRYHSYTFKCLKGSNSFFCNKKCFNKAVGISINRKYQYDIVMMSNDHYRRSPRNEHFANIITTKNKYLEISPSLWKMFCIKIFCQVIQYPYKHKTNDSGEIF